MLICDGHLTPLWRKLHGHRIWRLCKGNDERSSVWTCFIAFTTIPPMLMKYLYGPSAAYIRFEPSARPPLHESEEEVEEIGTAIRGGARYGTSETGGHTNGDFSHL